MSDMERELSWEDTITKDSEYELLPEGDYDFEVTAFERGRHNGSDKLPACNKAIINLYVTSNQAAGTIKHNLFLHTRTQGLLSAFFIGIGQKKKGEDFQMNWNAVIGSKGRCKVGVQKWKGNDGSERSGNEIKKFYEPEEKKGAPGPQQSGGFTPGQF